ncbi:MAG TPA: hypothetical protein VGP48_10650, partial [Stellaceae bacterium]|nr:hypothetical protein [Stellaceae bacterium]
ELREPYFFFFFFLAFFLAFLFAAMLAFLLTMGSASAHPMHQPHKKFIILPRICVARMSTRKMLGCG